MQNTESVRENEICKILWDSDMQTDYQILARRLDLGMIIMNKRTCWIVDLGRLGGLQSDNQTIKKNTKRETSTWILLEN